MDNNITKEGGVVKKYKSEDRRKMHKKWFRARYLQRITVALIILAQIAIFFYILYSGSNASTVVAYLLNVISIIVAVIVAVKHDKEENRLLWMMAILIFPVFGGLMYLLFHSQSSTRKFKKMSNSIEEETKAVFFLPENSKDEAVMDYPKQENAIRYLQDYAGFPIYDRSKVKYLSPGEVKFEYMIDELKKAERYIFMEYFIIEEGVMWDTILDILKEKAARGVEVRLIYDDMGCFLTLPKDYPEKLERFGIKCIIFNPFRPFVVSEQNNRDHRKIAVIDGKVAFTGGINLADEYINAYEKYGHWKDASVMVCGVSAWSFTVMFLRMWRLCSGITEDFHQYYPWHTEKCDIIGDGYVQPYCDSPTAPENVGEHVYLQIINNAKKYIYINTPYLVIGTNIVSALTLAAKSGVDVRIVTPYKWDKFIVHMTTRSYYSELIRAGVKIYEYSSGFIHSKTFVSDDEVATVGTTNLDFRSLYLHFECGLRIAGGSAVNEVKSDFLNTLEKCKRITEEDCKCNIIVGFIRKILRVFAPLM